MSEQEKYHYSKPEKIDLLAFADDFFHRFKKLWWIVVLCVLLCTGLYTLWKSHTFVPSYTAKATVSVELVNGGTQATKNTVEQMSRVFPYILTSGALSDVIAADLGMKSVPGTISVESIKGTNLLTVSVSSHNAQQAYDVLQSMLKNYPEVAQFVIGQTELTVIDDSGVPAENGREQALRAALGKGALAGLLLGLLLLMGYAAVFRTVRSEDDLRGLLNLPVLGTLPVCRIKQRQRSEDGEINIALDSGREAYAEAIRLVRTRLERQMNGKKVLLVTSTVAGEGKSTVAANLALSIALKGKKVILVDCDLRKPTLDGILRIHSREDGLSEVLDGEASLGEALCEAGQRGSMASLRLLPSGEKKADPMKSLCSEAMNKLIGKLRGMADVVILDTPPSAMLADATLLLRYVDAVVYVVRSDYARRSLIVDGVEELSANGADIVGCVLNGGKSQTYGYGYRAYGAGER